MSEASVEEFPKGTIYLCAEALERFRKILRSDAHITGHHIFYDLGVLCAEDSTLVSLVFAAIDAGRVHCTRIRQMIIDNADGWLKFLPDELEDLRAQDFSLKRLVKRHLQKDMQKGEDTWRLRYYELDGVPLSEWPEAALSYAIGDAVETLHVYRAQEHYARGAGVIGEAEQIKAAWALYLASLWGICTDGDAVEKLKEVLRKDYGALTLISMKYGYMRPNGTKDMAAIREAVENALRARGLPVQYTSGGKKGEPQISTTRAVLKMTGDEGLEAVAEGGRLSKVLTTYVPVLELGTRMPINARYNCMVETFRTSCSQPNLQNPPRAGGVRECFIPRPGRVFAFCDYDTLEMRTLAQCCIDIASIGFSSMADAVREGKDLHLAMAAKILKRPYEDVFAERKTPEIRNARQLSKISNFGYAGGMGAMSFIGYAKGYGVKLSLKESEALHQGFRDAWPEMPKYFTYCGQLVNNPLGEAKYVAHPRTKMVRGKIGYTQLCNHFFQHLAACGAKDALFAVQKECYIDRQSPLFGCRSWLFLHDEIGIEIPYTGKRASDAAYRLQTVMVAEMTKWVPDVPIGATVAMHRNWVKGGEPVVKNGILVPGKREGDNWIHDA